MAMITVNVAQASEVWGWAVAQGRGRIDWAIAQ